jgi:hypothetical protein
MKKILFTSVAIAMAAAAYGCSDSPANDLLGSGPSGDGSSGSSSPQGGSSSGTTATSGGLAPAGTSTTGTPPPPPPAGACLPPNVQALFAAKCTSCHSDPPINGSLSGLVTLADLLATSKEDPSKNEAQLSLARMQSASSPMPPSSVGNPPTAAEIATLQTWINANYTSASCVDGGGPPPPPATDVFTGAPAYVMQVGRGTHNAGKNCMGGCHNHGFTLAGTVTDGAGSGVGGVEVRLVDANKKKISVYSGSNGNFYSSSSWVAPATVGVRNASAKNVMVTSLAASNGGCNGCHATGGTQSKIHIP